ncbi:MAG: sulfatase-like hydrolase/transferase [Kofleriaceae bacterium]
MPARPRALARLLRWLALSVGAAAAGALAGAIVDTLGGEGAAPASPGAGYVVLGLWPALALIAVSARLIWLGWRPARDDADDPGDERARAAVPGARLLAGSAALACACAALGWIAWGAIAWASRHTAFRAPTLGVLVPLAVTVGAAVVAAATWPLARAFLAALTALDGWWRRRRGRALLSRRRAQAVVALAAAMIVGDRAWALRAWLPALPRALVLAPALAAALTAALHHPWPRRRARWWAAAASLAALVAVALALHTRLRDPARVLDAWSAPSLASEVIERVHSLAALRGDVRPAVALEPRPGAPHPDVILLTIDTVRADRAPPVHAAAMPALAALASRGAAFTRAFAPGTVTRRSIPSLAIGVAPTRVRGQMYGWALRLDPRHVLLAERFAAAGYQTAGFLCCKAFWGRDPDLGWSRGLEVLELTEDGDALAAKASAWLAARAASTERRPLLLWMHFMEPHKWNGNATLLPAPDQILPRYDAALTRVDGMLATVLRALEARSGAPPLLAITADHGEGLGDHDTPYHSTNLYNSLLRVPLILAGPGVVAAQHDEVVGLVDLAPTLIELAGFIPPAAPELEGRSLADLARGERRGDPDGGYAYAAMIPDRTVTERREAVVQGRWKLISGRSGEELYDYVSDPGETRNLAGSSPMLHPLRKLLRARAEIDARSPFRKLAR